MKNFSLNDDELHRLGALISYLLKTPRFPIDDVEEYTLPLFRLEQIILDSEDLELLEKINNQIF